MSKRKAKPASQDTLLGDLESIRTLLNEEDEEDEEEVSQAPAKEPEQEPVGDDLEVPVLEDIVDADPVGAGSRRGYQKAGGNPNQNHYP
jgi:hypothetical protein